MQAGMRLSSDHMTVPPGRAPVNSPRTENIKYQGILVLISCFFIEKIHYFNALW
jgi:hypothetical protein